MDAVIETLKLRIEQRIEELRTSAYTVSKNATGNEDAVRRIYAGHMPNSDRLERIAAELGTTSAWLLGREEGPHSQSTETMPAQTADPRQGFRVGPPPRDVKFYGTALAHDLKVKEDGHTIEVEQHILELSDVIDWRARPPRLIGRKDAYGVYVHGTSMQPRYDPGDPVYVDPKAPLSIGDDVIVQLYVEDEEDSLGRPRVGMALIKRLVRRSATWVELEQFEPASRFRIEMIRVAQIHRIVPRKELDMF